MKIENLQKLSENEMKKIRKVGREGQTWLIFVLSGT